jgi:hypothetical protein
MCEVCAARKATVEVRTMQVCKACVVFTDDRLVEL